MRAALVIAFAVPPLLAACASSVGYGAADYDSIRTASQDCAASGGHLQLKAGYDGRQLSSYVCERGRAP